MTSPYAFGTETFSKQTHARGITKGAAIYKVYKISYKRLIYIRYLICFVRYFVFRINVKVHIHASNIEKNISKMTYCVHLYLVTITWQKN